MTCFTIFKFFQFVRLSVLLVALSGSFARGQTPQEIVAGIDDRIEQHRKRDIQLQLMLPDGSLLPQGTPTSAALVRHEFLFGCNIFSFGYQAEVETQYRDRFKEAFNYATLNFIWDAYEPHQGLSERSKWTKIARWCHDRHISTKGHPLVWSMEPDWVRNAGPGRDEQLVWQRAGKEASQFKGLIDSWDVINETTEGVKYAQQRNAQGLLRAYRRLGTAGTVAQATSVARKADPQAKLVLNDFVTTDEYSRVIEDALKAGADIDAIGVQSHMHIGYWRVAKLWEVCERFARFGKPVHFTELSILSGRLKHESDTDWSTRRNDWHSTTRGEEIQAAQVFETYRLLFSHPAVEAISWWDLSDRGAWMGAPAGLLRADMSPKPAYYRVYDLIHKGWRTQEKQPVDGDGQVGFRGFYGDYQIRAKLNDQVLNGSFRVAKRSGDSGVIQVWLAP